VCKSFAVTSGEIDLNSQFYRYFMFSFFTNILLPKNYKAKL
jgi:hypothetical protein